MGNWGFLGLKMVVLFLNSPKMSNDKCKQVKADVQTAAERNVLGRNRVKHRVCVFVTFFKFFFFFLQMESKKEPQPLCASEGNFSSRDSVGFAVGAGWGRSRGFCASHPSPQPLPEPLAVPGPAVCECPAATSGHQQPPAARVALCGCA